MCISRYPKHSDTRNAPHIKLPVVPILVSRSQCQLLFETWRGAPLISNTLTHYPPPSWGVNMPPSAVKQVNQSSVRLVRIWYLSFEVVTEFIEAPWLHYRPWIMPLSRFSSRIGGTFLIVFLSNMQGLLCYAFKAARRSHGNRSEWKTHSICRVTTSCAGWG